MEKYKVTMKVEGYLEVEVDAENVEQARRTAIDKYYAADLGPLKLLWSKMRTMFGIIKSYPKILGTVIKGGIILCMFIKQMKHMKLLKSGRSRRKQSMIFF